MIVRNNRFKGIDMCFKKYSTLGLIVFLWRTYADQLVPDNGQGNSAGNHSGQWCWAANSSIDLIWNDIRSSSTKTTSLSKAVCKMCDLSMYHHLSLENKHSIGSRPDCWTSVSDIHYNDALPLIRTSLSSGNYSTLGTEMYTNQVCGCEQLSAYIDEVSKTLARILTRTSITIFADIENMCISDRLADGLHNNNIKTSVVIMSARDQPELIERKLASIKKTATATEYLVIILRLATLEQLLSIVSKPDIQRSIDYDIELLSRWIILLLDLDSLDGLASQYQMVFNTAAITVVNPDHMTKDASDMRVRIDVQLAVHTLHLNMNKHVFSFACYAVNCTLKQVFPNIQYGLNGRTLNVGTNFWSPAIIPVRGHDGTVMFDGYCIEVLRELASYLNFTYNLTLPTDGEWGGFVNGSWTGLMGMLERKEIDLIAAPMSPHPLRLSMAKFLFINYQSQRTINIARAEQSESNMSVISVVSLPAIFLLCGASITVAAVLFCFERMMRFFRWTCRPTSTVAFSNILICTYGALLGQGNLYCPASHASRTVLGFWWLFSFIFVHSYIAILISTLAVPKHEVPFRTVEELISQHEYTWGLPERTATAAYFEESRRDSFRGLWNGVLSFAKSDPSIIDQDIDVHIQKMLTEKYAYIGDLPDMSKYNLSECRILRTGVITSTRYMFALHANSSYADIMDSASIVLFERGILDALRKKWFVQLHIDCKQLEKVRVISPYGMAKLRSSFILLLIGIGISVAMLMGEHIICKLALSNDRRRR